MENLTITIAWSEEEKGYMYDIYNGTPEDIERGIDSEDGGCCTGSLSDALEMANEQAKTIVKNLR